MLLSYTLYRLWSKIRVNLHPYFCPIQEGSPRHPDRNRR